MLPFLCCAQNLNFPRRDPEGPSGLRIASPEFQRLVPPGEWRFIWRGQRGGEGAQSTGAQPGAGTCWGWAAPLGQRQVVGAGWRPAADGPVAEAWWGLLADAAGTLRRAQVRARRLVCSPQGFHWLGGFVLATGDCQLGFCTFFSPLLFRLFLNPSLVPQHPLWDRNPGRCHSGHQPKFWGSSLPGLARPWMPIPRPTALGRGKGRAALS